MRRLFKHSVFWIVVLVFQITRSQTGTPVFSFQEIWIPFLEHLTMLPILIGASYFTADFILPRYFYTRKYVHFTFFLLFSAVFFIFLMRTYLFLFFFPIYYPAINNSFPGYFDFNIFQHIFYIYSIVAFVVMFKYISRVKRIEEQKNILEKQNLTSELAFLHSQINPHFLFNTLNNINALIIKDPQLATASVVKLSEIMRYMLNDTHNERVLLANEIDYLKSFIGLLLLRIERKDFIKFEIKGDPSSIWIAPMVLIPFVENAYKHGNKEVSSPGIEVLLVVNEHFIDFSVTNHIKPFGMTSDSVSGIGIPNLKRRLDLLYPENHVLEVKRIDNKYFASLTITLKAHDPYLHSSR